MKILLIFPPSTIYGQDPTVPGVVPPLGLAYLGAYLEKHGYDVAILDARSRAKERIVGHHDRRIYGLTESEIQAEIAAYDPDVVGISVMYTGYSGDGHVVARAAKRHNPNIVVVMGGSHASTFPLLVLKDKNVDVVVQGEGEETFLDLVTRIKSKTDYSRVSGTLQRLNGVVLRNPERPQIPDLNGIPLPARHLLDMSLYLEMSKKATFCLRRPNTTMITSRGCPKNCVFCSIQTVWGNRTWRGRSADNVIAEIEHCIEEYNVTEFHWLDDSAATNRKRFAELCNKIIERRLDIRWTTPNGIAHWELNEETLDLMKAAGCYRITFGIEAANMETRKFIGKPHPLDQAKRLIQHANKIGMWTICTNILGFPYEKEESIRETISFAMECDTDVALFYLLCPHPGTEVYEIFKQQGILDYDHILDPDNFHKAEDFEFIGRRLTGLGTETLYFTAEQLQGFMTEAYRVFSKARMKSFLNPRRLMQKIHSFEDFAYIARLGLSYAPVMARMVASKTFSAHKLRSSKLRPTELELHYDD